MSGGRAPALYRLMVGPGPPLPVLGAGGGVFGGCLGVSWPSYLQWVSQQFCKLGFPPVISFSDQKLLQSSVSLKEIRGSEVLLGPFRLSLVSICYSVDFPVSSSWRCVIDAGR